MQNIPSHPRRFRGDEAMMRTVGTPKREGGRSADQRNQSDRQDQGQRGDRNEMQGRNWSPWLLIRYAESDIGLRPIPDGEVFWASPDIWVAPSDASGNPVAGNATFVYARIFNLGKATSYPTRIDFYWGDPTAGLGPGQMNLIGTEWPEVDAHRSLEVRCRSPWVPIRLNDGHECLIVNCVSPIFEWNKATQRFPFQPRLDRRSGQRNLTVLAANAGQNLNFWVGVNNVFPMVARVTMTARLAHVSVPKVVFQEMAFREIVNQVVAFNGAALAPGIARGVQQEAIVRDVKEDSRFGRSAPQIRASLSEGSRLMPFPEAKTYLANLLLGADQLASSARCAATSRDIAIEDVSMGAFEQRRLGLELGVPANVQPGEFIVFHLLQSIQGLSVGGYTIVVHVAS